MRITYLMVNANWVCGGNRTVFGQVNGLIERGYEVKLLALHGNSPFVPLKTEVINVLQFEGTIPPSDIVVVTFNIRALPLYHPKNEIPFYLVLIYESLYDDDPNHQEICDLLYRSPINLLCNSETLQDVFGKRLHRQAHWIPHATDLKQFSPVEGILSNSKKRILMMYRGGANKGLEDGLVALKMIKERCPGVEIVMFGTDMIPKADFPFTFFFNPPQERLSAIYSSCDVFILPSHLEGFPRPRLEAMACGVAVATTDCQGGMELAIDGETALVVPPKRPELLAKAAVKLIENDSLREKLARRGYEKAQEFNWKRSIDELEQVFVRVEELKIRRSFKELGEWEKVVAISPEDAWARYQLGIELCKKRSIEEAQREFEEAIRIDSSFQLPYEGLKILRSNQTTFPQDWSDLRKNLLVSKERVG